jgi:hypothetical protein
MIMEHLEVDIIKYTQEDFPGWVLLKFNDSSGKTHYFEEKVPIVSNRSIDENSFFPQKGFIRGNIIDTKNDVVCFSTLEPDHIESKNGVNTFYVDKKQIFKFNEELFQNISKTIDNDKKHGNAIKECNEVLKEYRKYGGKQKDAYYTLSNLSQFYDEKNMETEYDLLLDVLDFVVGYCSKENKIWEEYLKI